MVYKVTVGLACALGEAASDRNNDPVNVIIPIVSSNLSHVRNLMETRPNKSLAIWFLLNRVNQVAHLECFCFVGGSTKDCTYEGTLLVVTRVLSIGAYSRVLQGLV